MNKCDWVIGTPCAGNVTKQSLFGRGALDSGLTINICDKHLAEHQIIIALHNAGSPAIELLHKSPEELKVMFDNYEKAKENQ